MTKIAVLLTMLAAAACAFGACGGSDTTTTTRAVPTTGTVAPVIEHKAHTGDASLDQVLDTALAQNQIEMARLTGYEKVPCAKQADAQHPACRSDEKVGANVEVLPKLGCDSPTLVRPEDVPPVYGTALGGSNPTLTAVYQPASDVDAFGAQDIAVIATGKHDNGADKAVALHIKNGRIVAIEDDCGDALKLIDTSRVASWVVRPGASGPDTPTAAAATTSASTTPTP
ncbi:MAG TPA: hypothetical protein VIE40_01710 [Dehalococcoidia bacterium]